jgi:hypothetical protein
MSCETAMRTRLLQTEAGTLVGGRIYPHSRPQGTPLPALTYFRVGELRADPLTHADPLTMARIQYDAWAAGYGEVYDLALTAQRALKHYQLEPELMGIWLVSQQQFQDEATNTYRVMMEWDVWTREE